MRGACCPAGIGGGVDVCEGSVGVGVGLVISWCVGGADAVFVGASSVMMPIVVGSVSYAEDVGGNRCSCRRVLVLCSSGCEVREPG